MDFLNSSDDVPAAWRSLKAMNDNNLKAVLKLSDDLNVDQTKTLIDTINNIGDSTKSAKALTDLGTLQPDDIARALDRRKELMDFIFGSAEGQIAHIDLLGHYIPRTAQGPCRTPDLTLLSSPVGPGRMDLSDPD